jgi:hypothetical protein
MLTSAAIDEFDAGEIGEGIRRNLLVVANCVCDQWSTSGSTLRGDARALERRLRPQ